MDDDSPQKAARTAQVYGTVDELAGNEVQDAHGDYEEETAHDALFNEDLAEDTAGKDADWEVNDEWDDDLEQQGIDLELHRLEHEFHLFDAVDPAVTDLSAHKHISTRWVYRKKHGAEGNRVIRARFVA